MIEHIHDEGRKVAALCGSPYQARKHADAGVDIIIAQGGEGGGHSGEVGSIVLWPQVVKEVAPVPVLAAGGIGSGQQIAAALALGAQGAWTGSQWLMVEEAENTPVQQAAYVKAASRDTVRSRSFTGKPCRMLRNDWTEAWENPDNPKPLGMPLQYMVSGMAVAATHQYPDQTVDVAFNPVGQVVGQFTKVEKTAAVIERWVQEYLEATEHARRSSTRRPHFDSRLGRVRLTAAACAGFLLAVLWMDLIFDTQALRHRGADVLPESVLDSISGYYHRATTTSRPMSHLIALVMVILLAALGFRWTTAGDPGWLLAALAVLGGVPILLALIRTVPNAVRLGNRVASPMEQSRLARSICRDHLLCLGCMSAFLVLWVATASPGIR